MTHPKEAVEADHAAWFMAEHPHTYRDMLAEEMSARVIFAHSYVAWKAALDRAEVDITDMQHDLSRYMTIAGEEAARADRAEADKAAAVEAERAAWRNAVRQHCDSISQEDILAATIRAGAKP